jgi:F-type H+-transporting ATPase subunit epsilon
MRYNSGSETVSLVVSTGFAEVSDDKVSIIVDAAERGTEVDIERAQQAAERARERLAKGKSAEDIDYARAEIALKRAVARIKVAEKLH